MIIIIGNHLHFGGERINFLPKEVGAGLGLEPSALDGKSND